MLKSGNFLPQSYSGPTTTAASGAVVPRTPLVDTYPAHGVAYGLPLHAVASTTYDASRPYKHTLGCLLLDHILSWEVFKHLGSADLPGD